MKKKISKGIIALIFLILFIIGAYYYFNRGQAPDYFPDDTVAFAKIRSFKSFLHLDSPVIDQYIGDFKDKAWIRWLPDKDFYVAVDKEKNYYIFIELSFLAPLLKSLGTVEGNILCISSNPGYILKPGSVHPRQKERMKGGGDLRFVLNKSDEFFPEIEAGDSIWGRADVLKKHNAVKISYSFENPLRGEAGQAAAEKSLKYVPADANFLLKVNMSDFEKHYARLRKMVFSTQLFQNFLKTRKNVFEKTGIDIEKQIMPLLEKGMLIGARNGDDYFAVMGKEEGSREMAAMARELEKRYPVAFRERDFDGIKATTVEITGITGVLARSFFKKKIEGVKKPYYLPMDDYLLFFDSLPAVKIYHNKRLTIGIRPSSRPGEFIKGLMARPSHLSLYMDSLYLNAVYPDESVFNNFSRIFISADFAEREIQGDVVIKLKRNIQTEDDV
ncbi:MAG TPA: hypothetical protein ENN72_06370 [Firmicutes bacterium]|nr:hypothetical protein [Bacillota bacterium]